jgi:hypothetical protein
VGIICFDLFALIMIIIGWNAIVNQRLPLELNIAIQPITTAGWCFVVGGGFVLIASVGFALHAKAIGMLFVIGFVVLMAGLFTLAVAYQRHYD